MKFKPYVGVTGLVTFDEVGQVGTLFERAGYTKEGAHYPMLGILVSYKTLNGQTTPNRRYPQYSQLPLLVEEAWKYGMPMIHYNSRELTDLYGQLNRIISDCDRLMLKGVQLNIPWPNKDVLQKVREKFPLIPFVIQLSNSAVQGLKPREIAKRVAEYEELANYALIDPSGGKGKMFNLDRSIAVAKEIMEQATQTTIGFAGGLDGTNVRSRIKDLGDKLGHQDFSIDAEGGLRDKRSKEYGDDDLNPRKVNKYLEQSAETWMFSK